ncbi:MAG: hypothetical protein IT426_14080 [Pirellulales bacterium]|nr:hypothetical protein [Pirellulales bacterium]
MLVLGNFKRTARSGGRDTARRASKASRPQGRLRRLRAEPLERRELLSGNPLLHTFQSAPENDGPGAIATASVDNYDYVLIGARNDDTAGANAGAAYLYDAAMPNRQLVATLFNPNPALGEWFGQSVAFAGGNILVGSKGAAYLYSPDDASGQSWHVDQTFLKPPTDTYGFGRCSLTAVGDKVFVGSSLYSTGGAVHMFDSNTGQLLHTFLSPTPRGGAAFGWSVAALGNDVLIGEYGGSSGSYAGSVYRFDTDTFELIQTIQAPMPAAGDYFGDSLAVRDDGSFLVSASAMVSSHQAEAVYLFDAAGQWQQTIENPTNDLNAGFGCSVAFVGNNVLVGAYQEDTAAWSAGAAYLLDGSSGELLRTYFSPTPSRNGQFGVPVAALRDQVLIAGITADHVDTAVYLFEGNHPTTGDISGRVFADLNQNAIDDDGAALMPGFKVFLDGSLPGTSPNGILDEGELWTTPFPKSGYFVFYGLEPGTYTVAQVAADDWTPTIASQTVDVVAGKQSADVKLGAYIPTGVAVYSATGLPIKLPATSTTSQMMIAASRTILDLDLNLNMTTRDPSKGISVSLTAPNDVDTVSLGSFTGATNYNITFDDEASVSINDGTAPYAGSYRPGLELLRTVDVLNVNGTWVLTISGYAPPKGKFADTLNAWSITVTYPLTSIPPAIASLSDSPDPVAPGQTLTLTANGVSDDKGVASVAFYRYRSALYLGHSTSLLGVDTDGSNGWSLAVPTASNFPTGTYTYYAQATDTDGNLSNIVSTSNTVKLSGKPRGGSSADLMATALSGQAFQSLGNNVAVRMEETVVQSNSPSALEPQNARNAVAVDALLSSGRWADDLLPPSQYEDLLMSRSQEKAKRRPLIDLALAEVETSIYGEWLA